jgi:hypothetical protein
MTDCPNAEIRDLLPDLAHGSLDAATRARVEAHVAGCRECRSELDLLRTARSVLAGRSVPEVDVATIVRALPRPRSRARRDVWRWAAAAVVLVAVGGAWIALSRQVASRPAPPVAAAGPTSPRVGPESTPVVSPPAPILTVAEGPRPTASGPVRLSLAGGVADLSEEEMQALLIELEHFESTPGAEPESAPVWVTGQGRIQ